MDKFPEAFERFERKREMTVIQSFEKLEEAFKDWAKDKYIPTVKQRKGLLNEWDKISATRKFEEEWLKEQEKMKEHREEKGFIREKIKTSTGKIIDRYRDSKGRFCKKPSGKRFNIFGD